MERIWAVAKVGQCPGMELSWRAEAEPACWSWSRGQHSLVWPGQGEFREWLDPGVTLRAERGSRLGLRHCVIAEKGRICPELSECVGGMETMGMGREERKKSAPLTR